MKRCDDTGCRRGLPWRGPGQAADRAAGRANDRTAAGGAWRVACGAAAVVFTLAGCAGLGGKPAASPPAGAPAAPRAAPATPAVPLPSMAPTAPAAAEPVPDLSDALATEKHWLLSWFRGTPVRIRQQADGALLVDVPREYCFDPGARQVKPPLAAVLDKVAESLRRRPAAGVSLLAAPADRGGGTPLALQRAAQLQRHLRDRGVPLARLVEPSSTTAAAVQLRIGAAVLSR
jgi:hypothetical protein